MSKVTNRWKELLSIVDAQNAAIRRLMYLVQDGKDAIRVEPDLIEIDERIGALRDEAEAAGLVPSPRQRS